MKKIILMFILICSFSFAMKDIESETLYNGDSDIVIGELYTGTFNSENEKDTKLKREQKYLMEKDEFQYFNDKNGKNGIAFKASYKTPEDYTISFKGFCGDKYISVYGNYIYFDQLLEIFLKHTTQAGYEF